MKYSLSISEWILLVPAAVGSLYALLCVLSAFLFLKRRKGDFAEGLPPATILKPVCGLEKNQERNLASACLQDYPDYQVVFSVQDGNDPVLPLLDEIRRQFPAIVTVAVENLSAGPNRKVNNLLGALARARHELLVISDSDICLPPDYLKTILSPLGNPEVGFVCTLFKGTSARRWFERLELLTLNGDFIPGVIFAWVSGAAKFCLGCSVAFRRSSLREAGGFEGIADFLAEDYELGRRLLLSGKKMVLLPYFVETMVDLKGLSQWWSHQVLWDQKTRAANAAGFFAAIVTRSVPFALLFAIARPDGCGLAVLGGALGIRLAAAALILWVLKDRRGLRSLYLLPLRDMAALISWGVALVRRKVVWRGANFTLTRQGRVVEGKAS